MPIYAGNKKVQSVYLGSSELGAVVVNGKAMINKKWQNESYSDAFSTSSAPSQTIIAPKGTTFVHYVFCGGGGGGAGGNGANNSPGGGGKAAMLYGTDFSVDPGLLDRLNAAKLPLRFRVFLGDRGIGSSRENGSGTAGGSTTINMLDELGNAVMSHTTAKNGAGGTSSSGTQSGTTAKSTPTGDDIIRRSNTIIDPGVLGTASNLYAQNGAGGRGGNGGLFGRWDGGGHGGYGYVKFFFWGVDPVKYGVGS